MDTNRSRDFLDHSIRINERFSTIKSLIKADGILTTSEQEEVHIWKECYKEFLSATDRETENVCSCTQHVEHAHSHVEIYRRLYLQ